MTNKSGNLGTAAETAVVKAARKHFALADRKAKRGRFDPADVWLEPDGSIILEVKGGHAAWYASDGQVEKWLDELDVEMCNVGALHGALVVQRKGIGYPNAGRWWAIRRVPDPLGGCPPITVRYHLGDLLERWATMR